MELEHIKNLLEKYLQATTTLAEERALKDYFSGNEVAPELEQYAPMFRYFSKSKEERYTKPLSFKSNAVMYKWASIAAAVALLAGIYFSVGTGAAPESLEEQYTAEEIASAQEAFALLAMNFNKGTEQLYHLEEFEKSTSKFLNK